MEAITYGPGGFDPDKADGNVVERATIETPDTPPSVEERLDALQARVDAAAALAEDANATAQEVANAMKPNR